MPNDLSLDKNQEDGSWFLEAVGVKKPAPTATESILELQSENTLVDLPPIRTKPPVPGTQPDTGLATPDSGQQPSAADTPHGITIEMTSFDGDPGTSSSMFDPIPELPPLPSNVAVRVPRERHARQDVLTQSGDASHPGSPLQTRRTFRWPVFGLALVALAGVVLGILWLPQAAENAASATRDSYEHAALAVREFLPTAQASLAIVAKPSSTQGALDTVIPVVSELTSHASTLATVAAEPLPSVLPFVPSGPIDDLAPLRDRTAILATDASEIARQIGDAYVYRTSIDDLLNVGDLPTSADTEEINALSVMLASSLAQNASLVSELPANTAFDSIAAKAAEAVGAYAQWQEDYLRALAEGDAATAQSLVAALTTSHDDLMTETAQALTAFRESVDGRIVSLSREFDDHLAQLTQ